MNLGRIKISLKYKFIFVLLLILLSSLGLYFYFSYQIFSEDKKVSIADLNLTALRTSIAELKLELKTRLEDLQLIVPRIFKNPQETPQVIYENISSDIKEEVLRISFYQSIDSGKIEINKTYLNLETVKKRYLTPEFFTDLDKAIPISKQTLVEQSLGMVNRSFSSANKKEISILSLILPATFVNSDNKEIFIVVDLAQDFLRRKLRQSDSTEIFLISKAGMLLSHTLLRPVIEYARKPFVHPVADRLKRKIFPRESFETEIDGEPYLCNLAETGFPGIVAVSQMRKVDAYAALELLKEKAIYLSFLIAVLSFAISIVFASSLTNNIKKLKVAAEEIGTGNFKVKLKINSNDEVESVAESFSWMVKRIQELLTETANKARMQEELETARLVQSTVLSFPEVSHEHFELSSYYVPASECGGDILDAHQDGNKFTFFIGDATGHGAPAAIVTAVAKSCFSTVNSLYAGQPLAPDQIATLLNHIIAASCKGKLLMTMCIIQVDLETGKVTICNAGHESPLLLKQKDVKEASESADTKRKIPVEVLFSRGERLGFDSSSVYEPIEFQLEEGDTLLGYTDGVSEATNGDDKQWGERALKKAFAGTSERALSEIKKDIVNGIDKHTNQTLQKDDVTFILFKFKKRLVKDQKEAA